MASDSKTFLPAQYAHGELPLRTLENLGTISRKHFWHLQSHGTFEPGYSTSGSAPAKIIICWASELDFIRNLADFLRPQGRHPPPLARTELREVRTSCPHRKQRQSHFALPPG
jgi:hypothetical protein